MPPSWLTGKTNELDITKQSESRPANGGRLAKNLWSQLTLTRRAPPQLSGKATSNPKIGRQKLHASTIPLLNFGEFTQFKFFPKRCLTESLLGLAFSRHRLPTYT